MSIIQFFRIFWAYRYLTVITTVATVFGALVAVLIVPPSYEASTKVMLNILKPDPVTGQLMSGDRGRQYIDTQRALITDFGVIGQAVDQLGWTSNPDTLAQYTAAGSPDGGIRRWLAQSIIARTRVDVIGDTNILQISFRAATPTQASSMANALRDAFVESTLSGRRRDAMRNAEWFSQQADKERDALTTADAKKTAYERETGIVMQDDKTDIETARLRALAGQASAGAPMMAAPAPVTTSASSMELVKLDAQIAQVSKNLGANHPAMIELRARRAMLAKVVADDQAAQREAANAGARAMGAGTGALNRAVAAQTSKVVAQRDKIERLTQLQAEVNLHRDQMDKSLARAAELRQEAAVADPGLTVLGEAVTPRSPSFPNKPLILGGGLALGAALGLLLSLILELLSRRVRGVEDVQHIIDAPLMAVIPPEPKAADFQPSSAKRRRRFLPQGPRPASA